MEYRFIVKAEIIDCKVVDEDRFPKYYQLTWSAPNLHIKSQVIKQNIYILHTDESYRKCQEAMINKLLRMANLGDSYKVLRDDDFAYLIGTKAILTLVQNRKGIVRRHIEVKRIDRYANVQYVNNSTGFVAGI